ncbi:MAG TPA: immunoglobulin domain-containing protein, partial [Verrucomicrobiae bacterium]|nr:immunoglobulin domain-containing protein [Verrucomicrobiae bacterium]
MKAILRNLLFLTASCAAIFNVHAYILFQDNFNYTNGPIDVVSGSSPITAGGGVWVSGPGSLYGVTSDIQASGANTVIIEGTGISDLPRTYFTNGIPGIYLTNVPLFTNNVYYFVSNSPVAALYASFSLTVPSSSFSTGTNIAGSTYIAYFTTTNFTFAPRIYVTTNTATPGFYRVGINNNGNPIPNSLTNIIAQDLTPDLTYTIVVRVALSTGRSTMWINPTIETAGVSTNAAGTDGLNGGGPANLPGVFLNDVTGTNTPVNTAISGFGLRNSTGGGPLFIGNLLVGTAFEDVVTASAGSNPAFIAVPPANTTNFVGNAITLSVVAGGDPDTMGFQWSVGGVPLTDGVNGDGSTTSGSQTSTLTISNVGTAETASYKVTVTNAANPGGVSASANLVAISATTTPSWVTQPANVTVTLAGTANFTASASDGGPPVYYQWFHGGPIAGQTNSTLSLSTVAFTQAGTYSVTASNQFGVITSTNATLTVNQPAAVSIAYLRSTMDNTNFASTSGATNYTITGTVTTRTNLTT